MNSTSDLTLLETPRYPKGLPSGRAKRYPLGHRQAQSKALLLAATNAPIDSRYTDKPRNGNGENLRTDKLHNDNALSRNLVSSSVRSPMILDEANLMSNEHQPLNMVGTIDDDTIFGDESNDLLQGGFGDDLLWGGEGNDTLKGGIGNDRLDGEEGDDFFVGSFGNDTIVGGAGKDRLIEISDFNIILTDTELNANGTDSIDGIETASLVGGYLNNFIDASLTTISSTIISGRDGDDTLIGGAKQDVIRGGNGNDIIEGGAENDILLGGDGDDNLIGYRRDDLLKGEGGDDFFFGDEGDDVLFGGMGADVFIVSKATGKDSIVDFEDGIDRFGVGAELSFDDLEIVENLTGSSTLIRLKQSERVLAIVKDVNQSKLTADDFI